MSTPIEEQKKLVEARAKKVDDTKGLAVFNNIATPADTYREAFAQAVKPSTEIDYTQSNADKVINDYKDSELVNVVNSIKPEGGKTPVVNEDVPIIDTTVEYEPPTEEMKQFEEEKSEAKKFEDYINSIYSQEDYERDEKKKKAAQWITAAQMLGDSLTALGNSYFVAKGANNMGASQGAAKAAEATSKLYQDIRNAREKAAKAKMDATLKKYEMEMQRQDKKQAQENWQKTFDANEAYRAQQQKNFEKTEARLAEQARRNASVNEAEERRKAEQYNKQHGDRKFLIEGQWVNIPKDKWEGVVGSIYNSLPEEVRKVYETQVTDELGIRKETRKAPTIAVMDAAVRQYAQDPVVMEAILKAAGMNAEEVDPKKEEIGKEDTTDFSQFKRK